MSAKIRIDCTLFLYKARVNWCQGCLGCCLILSSLLLRSQIIAGILGGCFWTDYWVTSAFHHVPPASQYCFQLQRHVTEIIFMGPQVQELRDENKNIQIVLSDLI